MFTGIVKELLTITARTAGTPTVVSLTLPHWGKLALGESVLLHGICSTVTTVTEQDFTVEYMAETRQRTNVDDWRVGDQIHAEPALTLDTKLSGNLVYGHIDGTATVLDQTIALAMPPQCLPYLLEKGSVTINGVNLTIVAVKENRCSVHVIPETAKRTTLTTLTTGSRVNIECDYLTKVIVESVRRHGVEQ